jgi:hypothetical protein
MIGRSRHGIDADLTRVRERDSCSKTRCGHTFAWHRGAGGRCGLTCASRLAYKTLVANMGGKTVEKGPAFVGRDVIGAPAYQHLAGELVAAFQREGQITRRVTLATMAERGRQIGNPHRGR